MIAHRIDVVQNRIAPYRDILLAHPVYDRIDGIEALRRFMEFHVFAVWDFMSLLKALQRNLCCVEVPWIPPANAAACRLVNEIVLGEESDVDADGNATCHFDLYHLAMRRCGADTGPIDSFLDEIRRGTPVRSAIDIVALPEPIRRFVGQTFDVIDEGDLAAIASAFTFGREGLLPDVFRRIVEKVGDAHESKLDPFCYYLDRHIDVDDGVHGPLAEKLVEDLCGDDPTRWTSVENAAVQALQSRIMLWDAINDF